MKGINLNIPINRVPLMIFTASTLIDMFNYTVCILTFMRDSIVRCEGTRLYFIHVRGSLINSTYLPNILTSFFRNAKYS